jgi:hypothetical protein
MGFGEGDNQLTIENVNSGRNYIEADTVDIWGVKETIWTDRRFEDAANMMFTAQAMLDRLKNPWICYTVNSIDLFKRTKQDFDYLKEGRIVRVIDKQDDINVDTRIIEIEKPDVTKAGITVTIENHDKNVAGSIAALQERTRINETYAQGFETHLMIPFLDNADPQNPAFFEFYIPQDMVNINEAILRIQLNPFRAYSKAVRGGGGTTQSTTAGGGTTATSSNGGATTQSTTQQEQQTPTTSTHSTTAPTTSWQGQSFPTTSWMGDRFPTSGGTILPASQITTIGDPWNPANHNHGFWINDNIFIIHPHLLPLPQNPPQPILTSHGYVKQWTPSGAHDHGSHNHSVTITGHDHNVVLPGHDHTVTILGHSHTVTIPAHAHSVTVPNHQHTLTIDPHHHTVTIPDHTHEIEFGIFQGTTAQSISIRLDDNIIPIDPGTDLNHINAIPFIRTDSGGRILRGQWHRLEIVPDRMTRVAAWLFLRFSTNSRGGGLF